MSMVGTLNAFLLVSAVHMASGFNGIETCKALVPGRFLGGAIGRLLIPGIEA